VSAAGIVIRRYVFPHFSKSFSRPSQPLSHRIRPSICHAPLACHRVERFMPAAAASMVRLRHKEFQAISRLVSAALRRSADKCAS
jgi:hypothetical protein